MWHAINMREIWYSSENMKEKDILVSLSHTKQGNYEKINPFLMMLLDVFSAKGVRQNSFILLLFQEATCAIESLLKKFAVLEHNPYLESLLTMKMSLKNKVVTY